MEFHCVAGAGERQQIHIYVLFCVFVYCWYLISRDKLRANMSLFFFFFSFFATRCNSVIVEERVLHFVMSLLLDERERKW